MTLLANIRVIPLEPKANQLVKAFVQKAAVIQKRKTVILAYISKIIRVQRKIKSLFEIKRLKKRAVYERLNHYID